MMRMTLSKDDLKPRGLRTRGTRQRGTMELSRANMYTVAPERIWKCVGGRYGAKMGEGAPVRRQVPEIFVVVGRALVPLHFFGSKSTILVVLVSSFVMVSTVWSVSCLLFFYSRWPPCPAIVKVGEARAPVPYGVGATACISYWLSILTSLFARSCRQ